MTNIKNKSAQVEIKPRRMAFDTESPMNKYAFKNNSLISTFFYALSALFPDGERFFIHSVRNYRDDIKDETLKEQIRGFIGQEAHHGVSHEALNQAITDMGFPMDRIVGRLHKRVDFLKKFSRERQLALTVAMEHFTASLAEFLLKNPEILEDADPTVRKMLLWHAVEEIEHKAVAFDVYREHVNDELMRKRVMVISMISLFSRLAMYQFWLLRSQRHFPSWREWKEAAVFFWGKKGVLRDNMKGLAKFFKTGFHPWDIDQNYLIENWEERYPDIAALQVN
ncbi:MAG TPA: metal-dependent hydrolase [Oceanospirillales bacterium]|jgi:predicted metal-dependent hydrolase|nr:metal-dependent hydrolase [Oceanospirillales bacterium]